MELTNRIPHMMTVRQVAKTGLISEYALRQLVKQGKVPCIALEHKVLINFDAYTRAIRSNAKQAT